MTDTSSTTTATGTTGTTGSTTTMTSPPVRRSRASFYALCLAILIIGLLVMWHFGAFTRSPRIAMVTSGDTPYWQLVTDGAREAARQYDVKLTVLQSKTDEMAQSQAILGLLDGHYDGIAISPVNPALQAAILSDVAGRATLVTFDSDSPESNRLAFVGTDNYGAGRRAGQFVRQAIPGGGEVIVFAGKPDKESTQHRRQGLIDELLDRPYPTPGEPEPAADPIDAASLKGKEYTVVATMYDEADPAATMANVAKAVEQHPNLKCVVGLNGYHAPAIIKALDQSKKLDQIKIVGFDVDKDTLAGIEAGHVFGTIMQDQFGCGFQTVRILAETARGNRTGLPMFQRRTLPIELVTKDNVAYVRAQLEGKPMPAAPATTPAVAAAPSGEPTTKPAVAQ